MSVDRVTPEGRCDDCGERLWSDLIGLYCANCRDLKRIYERVGSRGGEQA